MTALRLYAPAIVLLLIAVAEIIFDGVPVVAVGAPLLLAVAVAIQVREARRQHERRHRHHNDG